MGTWNYRVLRQMVGEFPDHSIIEVFYDDNGVITGWVEGDSLTGWDDLDDLKGTVDLIALAFDKPILTPADMPNWPGFKD